MLARILSISKAIAGGLSAGIAALTVASADGSISQGEFITIAVAVIGGLGVVYVAPKNHPVTNSGIADLDSVTSIMDANTAQHYELPQIPPNSEGISPGA